MSGTLQIKVFENPDKTNEYFFHQWVKCARESIQDRGQFTVALSGGKTPVGFYRKLAQLKDPDLWSKTHIFLTDERFVDSEDEESNFRMIKEVLLKDIPIRQEQIHPVDTKVLDVHAAAKNYEEDLKSFFKTKQGTWPSFDLILLGLGQDGHTASLFPRDRALRDDKALVVGVSTTSVKQNRVSLSLPVINHGRTIIFLVQGEGKSKIVHEIIEGKKDYPASLVSPVQGELLFILDKAAARLLGPSLKSPN